MSLREFIREMELDRLGSVPVREARERRDEVN